MNIEMEELAAKQAQLCNVFGHSKRILILWLLRKQEFCVGEIAEEIGTSLQNTSQHLRVMKDRNIVQSRREGHVVYYRIAENEMMEHFTCLFNLSPRLKE